MLRVTAGELRGRRLKVPDGIRPTSELVRKAIFDILGDVTGLTVLDACAGSGALGIEALSRGAAWATFLEADRHVARCLAANLESLGLGERSTLVVATVASHVRAQTARGQLFDLILHDPPYEDSSDGDVEALASRLATGGTLVHERGDDHVPLCGLQGVDLRRYGSTRVVLYRG